jgi:hypothetical protein
MLGKLVPLFPFVFAGGAFFTDRIPDFSSGLLAGVSVALKKSLCAQRPLNCTQQRIFAERLDQEGFCAVS